MRCRVRGTQARSKAPCWPPAPPPRQYTALVGARLDEAVNAATPALWGAAGLAAAVQHEHGGEVMPDVAEFLDMLVSPHALCAKLRDT